MPASRRSSKILAVLVVLSTIGLHAQRSAAPVNWTAAQDHQNMMEQLGIKSLRPGPSGNESAPNHANYDVVLGSDWPNSTGNWVSLGGSREVLKAFIGTMGIAAADKYIWRNSIAAYKWGQTRFEPAIARLSTDC